MTIDPTAEIPPEEPSSLLAEYWPWLAGAVVALLAVIGAASAMTSRNRRARQGSGGSRLNQPPPTPGRAQLPGPLQGPPTAASAVPWQNPANAPVTRAEHDALAARVAQTEQQLAEQSRPAARPVQPQVVVPQQSTSPPSAPPPSAVAATSFASWCRFGGGLVDRHELFQSHLSNTLPDAVVEVVKRDLDSPARPVAFDAAGGNSAAAYWLVRVGDELLLFPQPQSPQQFRDLAPAFAGNAAPQTVGTVEPARVSASGTGYVLTQPGRIA